jgi:hypothetical protein
VASVWRYPASQYSAARFHDQKFLRFFGQRADESIAEITKQDVVAFRNSLLSHISADTVSHDLKALKMLFTAARRESAIVGDLTGFVETARRKSRAKTKCPFTLPELRSVFNLASHEWRWMIFLNCILASDLEISPP